MTAGSFFTDNSTMSEVDSHLRRAQVVFHLLVICGGLMACIGLGWDVRIFGDNCLLYSHMELRIILRATVDPSLTQWGPLSICYYCIFSTVMAIIYAIIWFWFYILLSNWETTADASVLAMNTASGTYRPPPDSRILLPTMFSSCIVLLSQLVNLGFVLVGGQQWCNSLGNSDIQCSDLRELQWRSDFEDVHLSYVYLQVAQAGSWIILLSIVGVTVIVGCRLHLHFTSSVFRPSSSESSIDSMGSQSCTPSPKKNRVTTVHRGFTYDKATNTESESEESQTGESAKLKTKRKQYNTV